MPRFGGDSSGADHVCHVFAPVICQSSDCFLGSDVNADDVSIGPIVVVIDYRFKKLCILAQHFGDVFDSANTGHKGAGIQNGYQIARQITLDATPLGCQLPSQCSGFAPHPGAQSELDRRVFCGKPRDPAAPIEDIAPPVQMKMCAHHDPFSGEGPWLSDPMCDTYVRHTGVGSIQHHDFKKIFGPSHAVYPRHKAFSCRRPTYRLNWLIHLKDAPDARYSRHPDPRPVHP